jgi:hypothetical protein
MLASAIGTRRFFANMLLNRRAPGDATRAVQLGMKHEVARLARLRTAFA